MEFLFFVFKGEYKDEKSKVKNFLSKNNKFLLNMGFLLS